MKTIYRKTIKLFIQCLLVLASLLLPIEVLATNDAPVQLTINIDIPDLKVNPYHKPYIAVWLETVDRKYVTTIQLLADDPEWHKDLRQWWRKVSRENIDIDAVTGATKRPGKVTINWDGKNEQNKQVPSGQYFLNVEGSREEGGRDYVRKIITLGKSTELIIEGKTEFGNINVRTLTATEK